MKIFLFWNVCLWKLLKQPATRDRCNSQNAVALKVHWKKMSKGGSLPSSKLKKTTPKPTVDDEIRTIKTPKS
jgi:hypothetical protein